MAKHPEHPTHPPQPAVLPAGERHGDHLVLTGGRVSPLGNAPAFSFVAPASMPLPVLIAVPHGGRGYFPDLLAGMRMPEMCQLRLEDRHIDKLGEAIACQTNAALLTAHAPRAMLDLNRAETDIDWDMIEGPRLARPPAGNGGAASNHRSRSGLGLIPRRLPGHGEVWRSRLPRAELDRRIADIHQPYHLFLAEQLRLIRDVWGAALLIDLHSMPPLPSVEGEMPAPVMVLGDRFGASCHHSIMTRGLDVLGLQGFLAAQNRPYSGGYVLDRHGAPQNGVHAIQIEVCRSIYLDENLAELSGCAMRIAAQLATLVEELGRHTAALGQARPMLEAAE
jgi:N-formylglutamate amidohydrolase